MPSALRLCKSIGVMIMKVLVLSILICFISCTAFAQELSVLDIMERNYQVNRTRDRCNEVTMEMYSKHGKKRIRKLKTYALLMKDGVNEKRLLRFLYPPDIKGTGFLIIEHSDRDDDMWLYLPTLRKSRRKLASNKKDSFLGTEFSYGDIVGAKVEEYKYNLKGEEDVDGVKCYVIEAIPASEDVLRNYGYSKRIDYIRADNFTRAKAIFFDKYGRLLKTLYCFNPVEVNHKWFVIKREMINEKNRRKTIIHIDKLNIDTGIKENRFTLRYLER